MKQMFIQFLISHPLPLSPPHQQPKSQSFTTCNGLININITVLQDIMVDIWEKHTNILNKPADSTFEARKAAILGYATV